MLNRRDSAVLALEEALVLQPDSLLIRARLAEIYALEGQDWKGTDLFADLGATTASSLNIADQYFIAGQYAAAALWYEHEAGESGSLPSDAEFRHVMALYRLNGAKGLEQLKGDSGVAILVASEGVRITGSSLRMLQDLSSLGVRYGESIADAFERTGNPSPAPSGVLWIQTSAGVMLAVPEPGRYQLEVVARHRGPAPANMVVALDERHVGTVSVAPEEGMWEKRDWIVELSRGLHLISIEFTNPLFVEGAEDRKLEIASLRLRRFP